MKPFAVAAIAAAFVVPSAMAEIVQVDIYGQVEYNQVSSGAFAAVQSGDATHISFLVDSTNFVNDPTFPTRGYEIDQASYTSTFGSVVMTLEDPFGGTPYFVLRDNDPAVDGFFLSTSTVAPTGLALTETGAFGQFTDMFSVSYEGDTLGSLDIIEAAGSYDFTGLGSFYHVVLDGPFEPIGMIFDHMPITVIPAPAAMAMLAPFALIARRRRG